MVMLSSGQHLKAKAIRVLGLNSPRETRDQSIGDWPSSLDRSPPSHECGTSVTNKQLEGALELMAILLTP